MLVKIQLLRDNGSVIVEHIGNAFSLEGWNAGLGLPIIEDDGQMLYGFTYLPVPPPRDPKDVVEFRRLYARYFSE